MGTPNAQIGWSQEAKLLQQLSRQLDKLICVVCSITTTSTTTTSIPSCFCYTVVNLTENTLSYQYTECGGVFIMTFIEAGLTAHVCSSTIVTGDDGLVITGGITPCEKDGDCAPL